MTSQLTQKTQLIPLCCRRLTAANACFCLSRSPAASASARQRPSGAMDISRNSAVRRLQGGNCTGRSRQAQ